MMLLTKLRMGQDFARMHNGAMADLNVIYHTVTRIHELIKHGEIDTLRELVNKAKNPDHEIIEPHLNHLRGLGFFGPDDQILDDELRNIVLSSTKERDGTILLLPPLPKSKATRIEDERKKPKSGERLH